MGERVHIHLHDRHHEWRDQEAINLSKWVRKRIDEEIEE